MPKGAAAARPSRYELSPEEYNRIKSGLKEQSKEEARNKASATSIEGVDADGLPLALRMDDYDDEDDYNNDEDEDDEDGEIALLEHGTSALAIDPESDDEDADDDQIRSTDALLIAAITEEDYSHIEIQLLSNEGELFVHHDITLPEIPLCLAWLDCPPFQDTSSGQQLSIGSYLAVGTFDPVIEIWNLDVLDPLEPSATLGGGGKKNKANSHSDAVMSLAWNKSYRQVLASGSADTSVKIWDITTQKCSYTFNNHKNKVQSVLFHPSEPYYLASGSYDREVHLLDCRSSSQIAAYKLPDEIECMVWDPFQSYHLYTSTESGSVTIIDVRNTSSNLHTFQAHDTTVTSLSFSPGIPGMLATASTDQTIKVWDMVNPLAPVTVAYKTMNVGKLFCMSYYSDDAYMLAAAGDKGVVAIWESDEQALIHDHFNSRIKEIPSVYDNVGDSSDTPAAAVTASSNAVMTDEELIEMVSSDIAVDKIKKDKKKDKKVIKSSS